MRIVWIFVAVIVVLCAALFVSGELLINVGIKADQPERKPRKKKSDRPETPAQRQLRLTRESGLAWKEAQTFETVSIQSRDGLRLIGYYLPCPQAKRTVLMVHGWRGSWEDMCEYGPFLREQRCNLLFVEQRGHGSSEGEYLGFGVLERYDCMRWIDWLLEREQNLPLYLFGCSQGGATVLMTAGFDLPEQVRGIIDDCGFVSPEEQVVLKLKEWWHLPRQPFLLVGDLACRRRAKYSLMEYSTLKAMETNRIPVLFVHGKEDRFVPVSDTLRNYEACKAEKDLLLVEGARHIQSYAIGGDAYRAKLSDFFQRCERREEEAG